MNRKQKFYNEKAKYPKIKQRGIFGFLLYGLYRYYLDRKDVVFGLLPDKIPTVLDVGSDRGQFLFKLAKRILIKGYGIDISSTLVVKANEQAKLQKNERKILFRSADIDQRLPFDDNTFSVVTCLAVLEHVFDPLFVFSELARVTKAGGVLVAEVPNIAWFPRRLSLLLGRRPRTSWAPGWDGGHLQYFTLFDLRQLFRENGFIIEKETCSGVFAPLRRWWLSFLAADLIILGRKTK